MTANLRGSWPRPADNAVVAKVLDPPGLLRWLAGLCPSRQVAIECGAGFGEVTAYLRGHFAEAVATDIAPPSPSPYGVDVVCAPAERIGRATGSVDLVVSMQALHHFDVAAHLAESRRVLRPGGVFAALSWGAMDLPPDMAAMFDDTLRALDPYWEPERPWVLSGYHGLVFPGLPVALPIARMVRKMPASAIGAEIARTSAARRAARAGAEVPPPDKTLAGLSPGRQATVAWPISGQVFRVQSVPHSTRSRQHL